jgi:hypothetical protein
MDYESERTRQLGCWDGVAACTGPINKWTTTSTTPSFEPDTDYCDFLIDIGFGKNCPSETRDFRRKTIKANYQAMMAGGARGWPLSICVREMGFMGGFLM